MKKIFTTSALFILALHINTAVKAQSQLLPDQNPDHAVSRSKYMAIADSVNQLHSTTLQQTYKAYDWYEAKMERRQNREAFRREIRLERARNSNYYYRNFNHRQPYYYPGGRNFYRNNSYLNYWCW